MNWSLLYSDPNTKFGYGRSYSIAKKANNQRFNLQFQRCKTEPLDWRSECVRAARIISNRTKKPLWICLSGGIDSEVVLRSFVAARVPIQVAIHRYNDDLNLHDLSWAVILCESLKVSYELFDFHVDSFFESDRAIKMAKQYDCGLFELLPTMLLMERISSEKNGVPVVGSGDPRLVRFGKIWNLVEKESVWSLYKFLIQNKIDGVPAFLQWSPEQLYSFIVSPAVASMMFGVYGDISDSQFVKQNLYEEQWPIIPRPKYSGFEKLNELIIEYEAKHQRFIKSVDQKISIPVHNLIKQIEFQPRKRR